MRFFSLSIVILFFFWADIAAAHLLYPDVFDHPPDTSCPAFLSETTPEFRWLNMPSEWAFSNDKINGYGVVEFSRFDNDKRPPKKVYLTKTTIPLSSWWSERWATPAGYSFRVANVGLSNFRYEGNELSNAYWRAQKENPKAPHVLLPAGARKAAWETLVRHFSSSQRRVFDEYYRRKAYLNEQDLMVAKTATRHFAGGDMLVAYDDLHVGLDKLTSSAIRRHVAATLLFTPQDDEDYLFGFWTALPKPIDSSFHKTRFVYRITSDERARVLALLNKKFGQQRFGEFGMDMKADTDENGSIKPLSMRQALRAVRAKLALSGYEHARKAGVNVIFAVGDQVSSKIYLDSPYYFQELTEIEAVGWIMDERGEWSSVTLPHKEKLMFMVIGSDQYAKSVAELTLASQNITSSRVRFQAP